MYFIFVPFYVLQFDFLTRKVQYLFSFQVMRLRTMMGKLPNTKGIHFCPYPLRATLGLLFARDCNNRDSIYNFYPVVMSFISHKFVFSFQILAVLAFMNREFNDQFCNFC